MACASGGRPLRRHGMAEAHPGRFRVSLFLCRSVARGSLFREDYAHYLSGFDVPEHFREPEFLGPDSHDFLFCLVRLIGVHLFRLRLSTGVVRREASPLSLSLLRAAVFRLLAPPFGYRAGQGWPVTTVTVGHGSASCEREFEGLSLAIVHVRVFE